VAIEAVPVLNPSARKGAYFRDLPGVHPWQA